MNKLEHWIRTRHTIPKARIDGVAATITALGLVLQEEQHGESVYETQELLVL
jgi:hypothetical protein